MILDLPAAATWRQKGRSGRSPAPRPVAFRQDTHMRVFVTGGTGFIGSRVVQRLAARGDDVCCLVRATSPTERIEHLGVETVVGDLFDPESLQRWAARRRRVHPPCRGQLVGRDRLGPGREGDRGRHPRRAAGGWRAERHPAGARVLRSRGERVEGADHMGRERAVRAGGQSWSALRHLEAPGRGHGPGRGGGRPRRGDREPGRGLRPGRRGLDHGGDGTRLAQELAGWH